jgi:hypothetical protein
MPKKRRAKRVKAARPAPLTRKKRLSSTVVVVVCCALAITVAGGALSHWGSSSRIAALTSGLVQATPTPLTLSKEYVYAGGRLVATEEPAGTPTPTPTPTAPGPANLVATATSPTQVTLSWSAPPSGAGPHYVVERSSTLNGYTTISANEATTGFVDSTASADTAYLYRVKAVFADNTESLYSAPDLATTVTFTGDDAITHGVLIKANHLNKLRRAVGAVRTLAGLQPYVWTYPDPVSMPASQRRPVYLEDVSELRAAVDEALTLLGRSQAYPASPALARGAVVNADHFTQIESRVE